MPGAYAGQEHARIAATVKLFSYYRAFLASPCLECRNPEEPRWIGSTLTKDQARARLTFLVNVAINRKAGIPDAEPDSELWRFSRDVNTPRLVVRDRNCPPRYRERLAHRLTHPGDECY